MQSSVSGTAMTAVPRRHHRLPRQPAARITTATPVNAIHTHSDRGAGLPANPSDSMYQLVPATRMPPTAAANGSQMSAQRRERQPIAAINTTAVMTWMLVGTQPCIKDRW